MSDAPITAEAARQALEAEKRARLEAFGRAVEAASREYRCSLEAQVIITPRGVIPQVVVVAQD